MGKGTPKAPLAADAGHYATDDGRKSTAVGGILRTMRQNAREAPKSSLWRILRDGAATGESRRPERTWGVLRAEATVPP